MQQYKISSDLRKRKNQEQGKKLQMNYNTPKIISVYLFRLILLPTLGMYI